MKSSPITAIVFSAAVALLAAACGGQATNETKPPAGNGSQDDLILWLAYKEAKALIQFDAAPPANAENQKK